MAEKKKINYNLIKKKIIKTIKASRELDFQEIDIHLVNRFVETQQIADEAFADIKLRGVVTPVSESGLVLQKNHSISAYNDALKILLEISKKLGLSARDRADLGMVPKKEDDF